MKTRPLTRDITVCIALKAFTEYQPDGAEESSYWLTSIRKRKQHRPSVAGMSSSKDKTISSLKSPKKLPMRLVSWSLITSTWNGSSITSRPKLWWNCKNCGQRVDKMRALKYYSREHRNIPLPEPQWRTPDHLEAYGPPRSISVHWWR